MKQRKEPRPPAKRKPATEDRILITLAIEPHEIEALLGHAQMKPLAIALRTGIGLRTIEKNLELMAHQTDDPFVEFGSDADVYLTPLGRKRATLLLRDKANRPTAPVKRAGLGLWG